MNNGERRWILPVESIEQNACAGGLAFLPFWTCYMDRRLPSGCRRHRHRCMGRGTVNYSASSWRRFEKAQQSAGSGQRRAKESAVVYGVGERSAPGGFAKDSRRIATTAAGP